MMRLSLCRSVRLRYLPACWLLLLVLSASFVGAVIKPDTSVGAGIPTEWLLQVKLGTPEGGKPLPLEVVAALKGEVPRYFQKEVLAKSNRVSPITVKNDAALVDRMRQALAGQETALVFLGDFWGEGTWGVVPKAGAGGALRIGTEWFGLYMLEDGSFVVTSQTWDYRGVWPTTDEALQQNVEYAAAHQLVDTGIRWAGDKKIADFGGKTNGAMAVDLGDGRLCLFVLTDAGDHLYRFAADGTAEEISAQVKLTTKSRQAAWGDFDGDGDLDLASWDGTTLTLRARGADGTFDARPLATRPQAECLGLAAIDWDVKDRAALLVSTKGAPLCVVLGADGALQARPIEDPAKATAGTAPCAVGDFDGDGRTDVVRPLARSILFYAGTPGATPKESTGLILPPAATSTLAGDFDGDGLLDVLVTGRRGASIVRNTGNGGFRLARRAIGSVTDMRIGTTNAALGDMNNDGRLDLVLTYTGAVPGFVINSGLCNLGQSTDLSLQAKSDGKDPNEQGWELPCVPDLIGGQDSVVIADVTGDGLEDAVLIGANGKAWVVLGNAKDAKGGDAVRYGLTVAATGHFGPVRLVAYDGKRCLGARTIAPGQPAFIGKANRGPVKLEWQAADGSAQSKTQVVMKSMRVTLDK